MGDPHTSGQPGATAVASEVERPTAHPASFRDPSGYVYESGGVLYRYVAPEYAPTYQHLMDSGLYGVLVQAGRLVRHADLGPDSAGARTLRPERLPFISHPYEWCFGQIRDAALATISLQRTALEYGMTLKDASAFNIAFHRGRAVLLDTLSFDPYEEGRPWVAYRQFCEHFLAPLALMSHQDVRLSQLLRSFLDGIPLDLASRLLPATTHLNPGILLHIHMHAKAQRSSGRPTGTENAGESARQEAGMSRAALLGLLDSLEGTIRGLKWEPSGTVWADYYSATNYTEAATDAKHRMVRELVAQMVARTEGDATNAERPRMAWDFGANDGRYSRLAAEAGFFTIAWDSDPASVERAWRSTRRGPEGSTPGTDPLAADAPWLPVLPLQQDLMNPSPDNGWESAERSSLLARGPADLLLALAVIHHLALGNNVPLPQIARFFARSGNWLLVEFVPKRDSQSQRLLAGKGDIFPYYDEFHFEAALAPWFEIVISAPIPETERRLYLCRRTAASAG